MIEIAELLKEKYALKSLALDPIVNNRRSFALRAKVDRADGTQVWCIKRHQPGKTLARVYFEERVAIELMQNGLHTIAAPVAGIDGTACFRWGSEFFSVSEFVDSDECFDWKKMTWTPQHCFAAGQALAAFHAVSRRLDLTGITSVDLSSPMGSLCDRTGSKQISRDLEVVSSRKRDLLVHGDFQPGNVLFKGSAVSAIVDFDYVTAEHASYDLAFALLMFCVDYSKPAESCLIEDFENAFMDGFGASLNRDELNTYLRIAAFLNVVWLTGECKKGPQSAEEYAVPLQSASRVLSSIS